jgi:hypothetical protein
MLGFETVSVGAYLDLCQSLRAFRVTWIGLVLYLGDDQAMNNSIRLWLTAAALPGGRAILRSRLATFFANVIHL